MVQKDIMLWRQLATMVGFSFCGNASFWGFVLELMNW